MFKVGDRVEVLINSSWIKGTVNCDDCDEIFLGVILDNGTDSFFMKSQVKLIQEEDKKMKFKKSDLKSGMVVECRNKDMYLVINEVFVRTDGYFYFDQVESDLTVKDAKEFDIMKVYSIPVEEISKFLRKEFERVNPSLLWERPQSTDWSKIPVDTLVEVYNGDRWVKRYFAGVKNGKPFIFGGGSTSFTVEYVNFICEGETFTDIRLPKED